MDDDTSEESRSRTQRTRDRLDSIITNADAGARQRLSSAVSIAGQKSGDLRTQLQTLSSQMADVARPVLRAVRDHIKENDIDVTISGNKIHIEGDEEGLKALNADLQETLKDKDVHVGYDRDGGLSVEVEDRQ